MKLGCQSNANTNTYYNLRILANQTAVSCNFQQGEGPSRGLLCEYKTLRNRLHPLFQALLEAAAPCHCHPDQDFQYPGIMRVLITLLYSGKQY